MRRLLPTLLAVVILLIQAGLAAHDYTDHDSSEICSLCLAASQHDHALVSSQPDLAVAGSFAQQEIATQQTSTQQAVHYNAVRAPPCYLPTAQRLSHLSGIPVIELSYTVGGTPGAGDLFGLFDVTLMRLLAVAQVAGLGLIAAHSFDWAPGGWQVQSLAFGAAALSVLLLNYTEKRWPQIQEALIGSLFVLASSGGILLQAADPHGGEHLKELLIGQILWVSYAQLLPVAILYALVPGPWFGLIRAALLDLPAGAMTVYTLAMLAALSGWFVARDKAARQ